MVNRYLAPECKGGDSVRERVRLEVRQQPRAINHLADPNNYLLRPHIIVLALPSMLLLNGCTGELSDIIVRTNPTEISGQTERALGKFLSDR